MPNKILYVTHNHPKVRAGGSEVYALGLYETVRDKTDWEAVLLARNGPPMSRSAQGRLGTQLESVGGDPSQYYLFTDLSDYDWLNSTLWNKVQYTQTLRQFLLAHKPDVVHFQHTLLIGYEALRETRNTLPDAAIVYTLHEFIPICHNNGQMVRTIGGELCDHESPRRCNECFPEISSQGFFLRKRFIQAQLDVVDAFVAPSRFLLERYVEWGIPREKILYEENGSTAGAPPRKAKRAPSKSASPRPRTRVGYFGQLNPYKGADLLVEAAAALVADGVEIEVTLHGANLEIQPDDYQARLNALIESAGGAVTIRGAYTRAELPALMDAVDWVVVPSRWWENSPLVIQEAFSYGKPVICSNVGGMAEKVEDGVTGLHFPVGNAAGLASVLRRAATERGLYERLQSSLPPIHSMDDHVATLLALYDSLLTSAAVTA